MAKTVTVKSYQGYLDACKKADQAHEAAENTQPRFGTGSLCCYVSRDGYIDIEVKGSDAGIRMDTAQARDIAQWILSTLGAEA